MNLFSLVLLILSSVCLIGATSVCYDNYSCFDDNDFFLPEDPTKIDTTFYLFNRNNIVAGEQIQQGSFATFREDLSTKLIIHGFKGNTSKSWIIDMKNELLRKENVNVSEYNCQKKDCLAKRNKTCLLIMSLKGNTG